jgi:hypothetical protein
MDMDWGEGLFHLCGAVLFFSNGFSGLPFPQNPPNPCHARGKPRKWQEKDAVSEG